MLTEVDALLARTDSVASRAQLLRVTTVAKLDQEIRTGRLVAVYPRAYSRPWVADDDAVRDRAALISVGAPAALCALTALRRWELPVPLREERHVAVPSARRPRSTATLTVHRLARVPAQLLLAGLPTTSPTAAVVESWPLLRGADARAPVLAAVRSRLTNVPRLRSAVAAATRLPNRQTLRVLLDLVAAGCESELELWGYRHVFDVPGLRHARRQLEVRVGGRCFRLDLAYEEEMLAVELDGRAFHDSPLQWERDIRRDGLLATVGWQTLRYSHARLHDDVAEVRRQTLQVLDARRRWRRGA